MLIKKKLYIYALAIPGIICVLFFLLMFFRPHSNGTYWEINPRWEKVMSDEINQPGSIRQVDASVISFMKKYNVPGLSIAIAKDDKLIYTKGYGYADVTTEEKVNTASLFRFCSISKPFTSAAIMKLLQEGKLSMNSKVFGVNGILKNEFDTLPHGPNIKEITISELLHHTGGGWTNDDSDPMFSNPSFTSSELLSWTINNQPLKNIPGTTFQYSNFGYFVLGRVIEKLTGMPYAAYVDSAILQPAGISDMQIGGSKRNEKKNNEVTYYDQFDPYIFNIARMDANGGWIGSASDLLRFVVRIDGITYKKDILDSSIIKIMLTPSKAGRDYACGWGSKNNFIDWFHTGGLPGSATELANTSIGFSWAILLNTRSDKKDFYKNLDSVVWKAIKDSATHWPEKDLF